MAEQDKADKKAARRARDVDAARRIEKLGRLIGLGRKRARS